MIYIKYNYIYMIYIIYNYIYNIYNYMYISCMIIYI